MDEAQLVRRCQAGDMAAFEALFRAYSRRLIQTAYLITADRRVAEEVMQEAFAQMFRMVGQLRAPEAFGAWLYRIAVREARRSSARERSERGVAVRTADGPIPSESSDVVARQALWEAIGRLPQQQRIAVVLHYFQDRPVAEIAEIMETPEGTVKSWLHRARQTLSREMGNGEEARHGSGA